MKLKVRYLSLTLLLIFIQVTVNAQNPPLQRVEPLNWWVGMKNHNLQLMVQGTDIGRANVTIDYDGVTLKDVHRPDNNDFLFLDLYIADNTRPGKVPVQFKLPGSDLFTYDYELRSRSRTRPLLSDIDQQDVIYLITPDRFANGDDSNDSVAGLRDSLNRTSPDGRHGGDIRGIISKLDYLEQLGVTTLWVNPLLTNAMPRASYHGYAITDFYHIDPRLGSNELYKELADKLHARHMKLIMDMVFNHSGLEHWWVDNPPAKDWIHPYLKNNFALSSVSDPHATQAKRDSLQKGWFVPSMPDLNQENEFLAIYLIQNSIWWIEYAGLDGIRMDTYPFNNQAFMKRWVERINKEYPGFYIVGETWVPDVAEESFWAGKDTTSTYEFNTRLKSITDFPLCFATHKTFKEGGATEVLNDVLSKDFLYDHPDDNLIFLDNHDMDRFFYTIGQNLAKYKLAMTFLLTTRGIPEIYYGTEILMNGQGRDGVIREDFPGGWKGDLRNAFTKEGRTNQENEAFEYTQKLLNWRKKSDAIKNGNLTVLISRDNLYAYKRVSAKESILVIINNKKEPATLKPPRFRTLFENFDEGTDVISGQRVSVDNPLTLKGNSAMVISFVR